MKKNNKEQKILKGKSISFGNAIGKAFIYKDMLSKDIHYYGIEKKNVNNELARIKEVFGQVLADIKNLEKNVKEELGKEQADIFMVHAEILKDRTLLKDIEKEVEGELVTAEHAVKNVFRKWANKFKVSENETIKSKADDFEDLSRRILCSFMNCDINILENVPPNSIVVAKRLLPSDTVRLKRKNVKGIIVELGSDVSHSAIISRSLGIPAVAGVENAANVIKHGEKLILDGYNGVVIQEPCVQKIKTYREIIQSMKKVEANLIARAKRPAKTLNGERVKVYANVASKEDVNVAIERGYDGIGLFRVEQVYMASKILPNEKYLVRKLSNILGEVENKVVTFRLLDIGADKNLPYLDIEDEPTPVLGLRGIRLLLKYKNLLKTQLRVFMLLSASYRLRILVPMVTFHSEIEKVREVAKECIVELAKENIIKINKVKIGAMIETPAAVENIEKIAKVSDFLSVGTNDLIQYSVAAGRDNPSVAEYYERGSKLAVKYIKRVAKAANRHDIECSVCGEIASDFKWVKPIINVGIRALSVSPYFVPIIKDDIRKI